MLVDDSAVIRGALTRLMDKEPAIKVVSSLSNGEMAVTAAAVKKPHIIILDVEMPVMDGLTALPKILAVSPHSKVIMFSGLTEKGAGVTLKALSLGAVECLVKPSSSQGVGEGSEFQKYLLATIRNLVPEHQRIAPEATSAVPQIHPLKPGAGTPIQLHKNPAAFTGRPSILAIGSSTGGPQALFNVTKHFKNFNIPIVITQHMPPTFTKILAEHITSQAGVPAFEGQEDMPVENGKIYIAPGGFHMKIMRINGALRVKLDSGPPENFCKPSVDPMLRTVIDIFGSRILGVILTGMGNDGLNSSRQLVEQGGRLIAQDEASSVVWGMPGAVAKAGLCSEVLPLDSIGPWIRKAVLG
ncbi:MAG: chemotaxis response regulator protein-glutamate methylesterase [Alphaproteobacteria bacterium]|nr:chemotaxis response regulator protein-glutamate methylesterase [Alphaproteobacteria bacterium]